MSGAEDREREASLKTVVDGLADVSDRTQNIVRDEIALAKAEVAQKVSRLGKGAAVAAVAGVFVALGGLFLLYALSWFFVWAFFPLNQIFWGFLITAALLFLAAALGGVLAYRFFKKGSPPVPSLAIEEAKLLRGTVQGTVSQTADDRTKELS